MSGLKIAALYGIKPHQLGFCGPQEESTTQDLLNYLLGKKIRKRRVKEILQKFEGAFSYYRLIAKVNSIEDPFDARVVKAYWIGNELLDNVSVEDLRQMIATEFSRPGLLLKELAERKAEEIPPGSKPHHSFHVLVLGSVAGRIILRGKLLDLCRVGWGETTEINFSKNRVKVKYQPLEIKEKYQLRKPKEKYINWNKNLVSPLKIGQQISFHWNQAIEVLTKEKVENLQKYTQKTLDALNSTL